MKTIYDQLEEEENKLKDLENNKEDDVTTEPVEDNEEPQESETEKTTEEQDPPKEEPKPEEKPDHAEMARIRFENSELKRQQREANEAAQRAIQLQNQQKQAQEDPEPNKAEDREEWLEWKTRQADKKIAEAQEFIRSHQEQQRQQQIIQGAIQELEGYEANMRLKAPDYDDHAGFVAQQVRNSISMLNPTLSPAQVAQMTQRQLLSMASKFENQGLDPAEAIYNFAKKNGYTPQKSEDKALEPKKASLDTIEKNKAKSANGLGGGGGKPNLSIAALEKASIADMYNYTDEEIHKAMYS